MSKICTHPNQLARPQIEVALFLSLIEWELFMSDGFTQPQPSGGESLNSIPVDEIELLEAPLGEMDRCLPVGVWDSDGQRHTDFKLRPFTGSLEVELEELFDRNNQGVEKVTGALREFLPKAVESIGGQSLERYDSDPRRLIDRMYLSDIFSLLLYIRIDYQESNDIAMSARCPQCDAHNADQGTTAMPFHDLSTVRVKYYRDLPGEPLFSVPLPDGITMGKKSHGTHLLLEPMKLRHLKDMAGNDPREKRFPNLKLLRCMCVAIPGLEVYDVKSSNFFDRSLYRRLVSSRKNKAEVFRSLNKLQPGPIMEIQFDCFACGHKWGVPITWVQLPTFLYQPNMPIEA